MLRGSKVQRDRLKTKVTSFIILGHVANSKANSGAIIGHPTLNQIWFSRRRSPVEKNFQLLHARRKSFCIDLFNRSVSSGLAMSLAEADVL